MLTNQNNIIAFSHHSKCENDRGCRHNLAKSLVLFLLSWRANHQITFINTDVSSCDECLPLTSYAYTLRRIQSISWTSETSTFLPERSRLLCLHLSLLFFLVCRTTRLLLRQHVDKMTLSRWDFTVVQNSSRVHVFTVNSPHRKQNSYSDLVCKRSVTVAWRVQS